MIRAPKTLAESAEAVEALSSGGEVLHLLWICDAFEPIGLTGCFLDYKAQFRRELEHGLVVALGSFVCRIEERVRREMRALTEVIFFLERHVLRAICCRQGATGVEIGAHGK